MALRNKADKLVAKHSKFCFWFKFYNYCCWMNKEYICFIKITMRFFYSQKIFLVWHQHRVAKHIPCFVFISKTKIQHPSTNKSTFKGTVYQHHLSRNQEESCPTMHWETVRQDSVLVMDPAVAHKPTPATLSCGVGAPGDH